MKLATYKDGSRDGQLVVVARDLSSAHYATGIADTLQQALDDWNFIAPQLQDLYATLNHGKARHTFGFDAGRCMAPLPRTGRWVEALNARPRGDGQEAPVLMSGPSDAFWGPCDEVGVADEAMEIDAAGGIAVVTGDLPLGVAAGPALDGIRLLLLFQGVCLRRLAEQEWPQGAGLLQSRPVTAFGPVAVTPDELGEAWSQGQLDLSLRASRPGTELAPQEMSTLIPWGFGRLLSHLARTRRVRAGAILGAAVRRSSGGVPPGRSDHPFLRYGDGVRLEVVGRDGQSVFGAIEQSIVPLD
jgi:fumarylacetoacetate (FAA) hydrolase